MKNKIFQSVLVLGLVILSGCASTGKPFVFIESSKFDGGYVAVRKGVVIPEYTIGRDNKAPKNLDLAKKRFKRRKATVDKYYQEMGVIINSNIEMGKMMGSMVASPFRMPFKIADYSRYKNDPEYRKKIDDAEELADQKEAERVEGLKKELGEWIKKDLDKEEAGK